MQEQEEEMSMNHHRHQSSAECATILKRGYLHEKKALLDHKRWYVLRQDLTQQYCVLEFYKDEKAAQKKERQKGFINIHNVVEAKRVPEKKQTFEILCPGVGYRLTAGSEAETDEWVELLRKLILYRKEERNVAFTQSMPEPSFAHHHHHQSQQFTLLPDRERDGSDPFSSLSQSPPTTNTTPTSTIAPTASVMGAVVGPTYLGPASSPPGSTFVPPPGLPTPPECAGSVSGCTGSSNPVLVGTGVHGVSYPPPPLPPPPASSSSHRQQPFPPPPLPPSFVRQRSLEFASSLPSPSTSSDSSSMCSGSNASFEGNSSSIGQPTTMLPRASQPVALPLQDGCVESETRAVFRVQVKEVDNLNVAGVSDLVITEDSLSLHSIQTGQQLVSWPIGALRRYGANNVSFSILTGRHCSTGEGKFQFFSPHSRLIHSRVHALAQQKANSQQQKNLQNESGTSESTAISSSPQYSTLDHGLPKPPAVPSGDPYDKLQSGSPSFPPPPPSSDGSSGGYNRLCHHSYSTGSMLTATSSPSSPSPSQPISIHPHHPHPHTHPHPHPAHHAQMVPHAGHQVLSVSPGGTGMHLCNQCSSAFHQQQHQAQTAHAALCMQSVTGQVVFFPASPSSPNLLHHQQPQQQQFHQQRHFQMIPAHNVALMSRGCPSPTPSSIVQVSQPHNQQHQHQHQQQRHMTTQQQQHQHHLSFQAKSLTFDSATSRQPPTSGTPQGKGITRCNDV